MRTRAILLLLTIGCALPAHAFFCFNFSFGSGNRPGSSVYPGPIPPPYWPPVSNQPRYLPPPFPPPPIIYPNAPSAPAAMPNQR